jgi:hypothetical protein
MGPIQIVGRAERDYNTFLVGSGSIFYARAAVIGLVEGQRPSLRLHCVIDEIINRQYTDDNKNTRALAVVMPAISARH